MTALLRLEATLLRRSRTAWAATAVFVLVIAAMAATTALWTQKLGGAAAADRATVDAALARLDTLNDEIAAGRMVPTDVDTYTVADGEFVPDPRDPFVTGFYRPQLAEHARSPMAALAIGAARQLPSHFVLNSRPLNEVMTHGRNAEIANPTLVHAGVFDLAGTLVQVVPLYLAGLLALGLSRERGTALGLLLQGAGAAPAAVLMARVAVAGGATAVLAVAAVLAGVAASVLAGDAFDPRSALGWLGVALGWTLLWAGLFACAIAAARTELGAAGATVGLWLALVVVLPGLAEARRDARGIEDPLVGALAAAARSDGDTPRLAEEAALHAELERLLGPLPRPLPACAMRRRAVLVDFVGRFAYDAPIRGALAARAARAAAAPWWSPASLLREHLEAQVGHRAIDFAAFVATAAEFHHRQRLDYLRRLVACDDIDPAEYRELPRILPAQPRQPSATPAVALSAAGLALLLLAGGIARLRSRTTA